MPIAHPASLPSEAVEWTTAQEAKFLQGVFETRLKRESTDIKACASK